MKTSVRIGAFEIDDGELHGESPGDRTLTIPCKSDPDLCMQLDARDAETSIPALLNGEHLSFTVPVTINNLMPGLCVLPDPKRTRRHGGLFVPVIPRCKISPKLNGTAPHFGDEMFALVLFVCYGWRL